jgi:hypothetical protein
MSAHLLGIKLARVDENGVLVLLNENLLAHASLRLPIFVFFFEKYGSLLIKQHHYKVSPSFSDKLRDHKNRKFTNHTLTRTSQFMPYHVCQTV